MLVTFCGSSMDHRSMIDSIIGRSSRRRRLMEPAESALSNQVEVKMDDELIDPFKRVRASAGLHRKNHRKTGRTGAKILVPLRFEQTAGVTAHARSNSNQPEISRLTWIWVLISAFPNCTSRRFSGNGGNRAFRKFRVKVTENCVINYYKLILTAMTGKALRGQSQVISGCSSRYNK